MSRTALDCADMAALLTRRNVAALHAPPYLVLAAAISENNFYAVLAQQDCQCQPGYEELRHESKKHFYDPDYRFVCCRGGARPGQHRRNSRAKCSIAFAPKRQGRWCRGSDSYERQGSVFQLRVC